MARSNSVRTRPRQQGVRPVSNGGRGALHVWLSWASVGRGLRRRWWSMPCPPQVSSEGCHGDNESPCPQPSPPRRVGETVVDEERKEGCHSGNDDNCPCCPLE